MRLVLARLGLPVVAGLFLLSGCQARQADPAAVGSSYQTLAEADQAFALKNYSAALPLYDRTISAGAVQGDALADAYWKRAVCRMEAGDFAGAAEDLDKAEQGGAAGDEYAHARKRLATKK